MSQGLRDDGYTLDRFVFIHEVVVAHKKMNGKGVDAGWDKIHFIARAITPIGHYPALTGIMFRAIDQHQGVAQGYGYQVSCGNGRFGADQWMGFAFAFAGNGQEAEEEQGINYFHRFVCIIEEQEMIINQTDLQRSVE